MISATSFSSGTVLLEQQIMIKLKPSMSIIERVQQLQERLEEHLVLTPAYHSCFDKIRL
jgi:hypothetical protein